MKLGRLILTHREDLIEIIRRFYAGARTNFLVIGYNRATVDPAKFEQADDFRLVPYEGNARGLNGQQWRIWPAIMRRFPEVERWVSHDYDVAVTLSDEDLLSRVGAGEYGMIGRAFPVYRPGMEAGPDIDRYPFPQGWKYWFRGDNESDRNVFADLSRAYPFSFRGVRTITGGYSDFLAASREHFLLLEDEKAAGIRSGGIEEAPHTIFRAHGLLPVDMRQCYRTKIRLDGTFVPLDARYHFLHSVKFWPGGREPSRKERMRNLGLRAKSLLKQALGREGWFAD